MLNLKTIIQDCLNQNCMYQIFPGYYQIMHVLALKLKHAYHNI